MISSISEFRFFTSTKITSSSTVSGAENKGHGVFLLVFEQQGHCPVAPNLCFKLHIHKLKWHMLEIAIKFMLKYFGIPATSGLST